MTWSQAINGAGRINKNAVYGTHARHTVTADGRHIIAVTMPDGRYLGTFTCAALAYVAAGLTVEGRPTC